MKTIRIVLAALTLVAIFIIPSQGQGLPNDPVCKEGEEYMSCGTACPETCESLLSMDKNRVCSMNCVPGCFCKQGLVRDTSSNKCLDTFQCKQPRDQQEYSDGNGALMAIAPTKWILSLVTLLSALIGRRLL